ncbi:MAG: DUF4160 domain-containing protein [Cytophagaceae bacterium]|jgi:hypothetical protein|nr:DUF4160 domain-containing protein [Cytophagaceae bacterium]
MQFYFWSSEHEPIHIHVKKGRCLAKFVVEPAVELVDNNRVQIAGTKIGRNDYQREPRHRTYALEELV